MSAISDATASSRGVSPSIRRSGPDRGYARGARGVAGRGRGRARASTPTHDNAPVSAEIRGSPWARLAAARGRGRFATRGGPRGGRGRGESGGHEENPIVNEASPRGGVALRGLGRASRGRGWSIPEFTLPSGQDPPEPHPSDVAGLAPTNHWQHPDQDSATELAADMFPVDLPLPVPNNELNALVYSPNDPRRPDYGVRGRAIRLRANYLPVQITHTILYVYHVHITAIRGLQPRVRHRVYQLAEQTFAWQQAGMVGTVAHDASTTLVASHPLPQPLNIDVIYHEELTAPIQNAPHYTLSITFVNQLNTASLIRYMEGAIEYRNYDTHPAVSALNLAHVAARGQTGVVRVGNRHFFHALGIPSGLDAAIEAWRGYSVTFLPAPAQLMVKVDVGTTSFHVPGNLASRIEASQGRAGWPPRLRPPTRVETTHPIGNSLKFVRRFAIENANTLSLETQDFGLVTVREYFQLKYGFHLQFPQLPLVVVDSGIHLPPEVCTVPPGQPFRGKLSEEQEARMSFGLEIGSSTVTVPGRVLPKPNVVYSTNTAIVNDRAQWNVTRAKFIAGARLDRWAVLVITDDRPHGFLGSDDPALRDAVNSFREMCNRSGMYITTDPTYTSVQLPPRLDLIQRSTIEAIRVALLRVRPKPDLVMAVLPDRYRGVYEGLKYLCDVILDVATICVLSSKIRRSESPSYAQYLSSVALKLNIKLGGINHRLTIAEGRSWLSAAPTMVMGMRVSHPSPGWVMGSPSVAAVVASVDGRFVHYPASLSIQGSRLEIIMGLTSMTIERLMLFKSRNNDTLPERILVYRSGLSESHFNHMRGTEVPSMLAAFQKLSTPEKPYRPKLTIVACRRKHHTWFWEEGNGDGNPPAGTVVDRGVTSVYDFDFYLQAHGGVNGTARPVLYTVVYDENRVSADVIQETTHTLSYMYAPATQAVSLAAPIRYAELASKRGRCYLDELYHRESLDDGAGEMSVMEAETRLWDRGGSIPGWGLRDTMFYI